MASLLSRRGERSNRVTPVREFFAHVVEWKEFHNALVASAKVRDVTELGQGYFARAIEQRLAEVQRIPDHFPVPDCDSPCVGRGSAVAFVVVDRSWHARLAC